jgi:hypothetical protein
MMEETLILVQSLSNDRGPFHGEVVAWMSTAVAVRAHQTPHLDAGTANHPRGQVSAETSCPENIKNQRPANAAQTGLRCCRRYTSKAKISPPVIIQP